MYWSNLQPAIGSTCKAGKRRAGKGQVVPWGEGGQGKRLGPHSAMTRVQERMVALWQRVHECKLVLSV